ncbi:unnamed protein product [Rotaria sordida]|uniref:Uncharacterized protein n=1 Tax=Rotaria sordida TaxID=392033 RepID=A0A818SGW5_9BILA|nr:unnamed protein product [Rotaria sordida]CAF1232460.1 unnamed protein product [Rotaria sordida]CAF3671149.1 unnamed protein product [Rotaria sordida]CAF3750049.1 unnamed protein product [Rotaria sordida]
MKLARRKHTASILLDGKVLVFGGYNTVSDTDIVEKNPAGLYDPLSGNWTNVGNISALRWAHTASLLLDGKVLVVGGGGYNVRNTAELYDPLLRKWTNVDNMTNARIHHTASVLLNGSVSSWWNKPNACAEYC